MLQLVLQLIGQADHNELGVDIREALRQHNMPMLSEQEYQAKLAQTAAVAAQAGPGEVAPARDQSGVVPTAGRAPATTANTPGPDTNTLSATGFAYTAPIEVIELAPAVEEFVRGLPDSSHYRDEAVRALSKQLWRAMTDFYREQYEGFASYLETYEGDALHLSDEDQEKFEFAPSDFVKDMARRIVGEWGPNSERIDEVMRRVKSHPRCGHGSHVQVDEHRAWRRESLGS